MDPLADELLKVLRSHRFGRKRSEIGQRFRPKWSTSEIVAALEALEAAGNVRCEIGGRQYGQRGVVAEFWVAMPE